MIGTEMNGFTITAGVTLYRLGKPSGVVILGIRRDAADPAVIEECVVAEVPLSRDDGTPASHWLSGQYTPDPGVALRLFAHKSMLDLFTTDDGRHVYPEDVHKLTNS